MELLSKYSMSTTTNSNRANKRIKRRLKRANKTIKTLKTQKVNNNKRYRLRRDNLNNGISRQANIPVANGYSVRARGAQFVTRKDSVIVSHREFVGNVMSSVAWDYEYSEMLNPGNVNLFPWLSKIASNYENYVIHKFTVHYVPVCPTTTAGNVIIFIDYDASDVRPVTSIEMLNAANAISLPPYIAKKHTSTFQQLNKAVKERYIHSNVTAVTQDPKFYNFGKLHVTSEGFSANEVIVGKLFLEYDIELRTPVLSYGDVANRFIVFNDPGIVNPDHPIFENTEDNTFEGVPDTCVKYNSNVGAFDSFTFPTGCFLIYISTNALSGQVPTFGWNGHNDKMSLVLQNGTSTFFAAWLLAARYNDQTSPTSRRLDIKFTTSIVGSKASIFIQQIDDEMYNMFGKAFLCSTLSIPIEQLDNFNPPTLPNQLDEICFKNATSDPKPDLITVNDSVEKMIYIEDYLANRRLSEKNAQRKSS